MTQPKKSASWQAQQREIRQLAVLDAAAELMSERGYAHTSMDDIAERVGISKPTLYHHFRSKNAIVESVMLRNLDGAEQRMVAIEANIAQGERARRQLEGHIREAMSVHQGLWAMRSQIPMQLREARKLRIRRERIWERYARIIEQCKADGDCRADIPTALLVRTVVRVFRGDYADLLDNGTVTVDELAHNLVSLLFDGMAPRAAAADIADAPPLSRPAKSRSTSTLVADAARGAVACILAFAAFAMPLTAQSFGPPATPAAAAGRPLTLADVLDAALRANPTARAAVYEARVSAEQLAAARGSWLPTVSFVPAIVVSQNTAGGSNANALSNSRDQRITFSPSLSLSYLLFDIGGRSGTVGAAQQSANAAAFSRDFTIQETVLVAEQSYFNFQAAQSVTLAQSDNVTTASANRDVAVGRFEAGIATVADTLQTATALAQARVALVNARTALVNARTALATVMGARADVPFRVAEETAPAANDIKAATSELTMHVDTLVAHALRTRADVAEASSLTAAASERVRVARSALFPAIELSVASGRTLANQSALVGGNYSVQFGLSLPLFDGGTRRANVRAAQAEVLASRARGDITNVAVVNQVVTSIEAFRLSAEQVVTTDELLASAQSSEDVAQGRYREGVGTIVDLITAQSALAAARSQAAQARWGWANALSQLSRDAGVLGPSGQLPVTVPTLPATTLPGGSARSTPSRQ